MFSLEGLTDCMLQAQIGPHRQANIHQHINNTHTFLQWCGTLCAEEFNVCVCGWYVWVSVWCVGVCGKICASVREISSFTHSIYIYTHSLSLSLSFSHWLPDLVIPCFTHSTPHWLSVYSSVVLSWFTYTRHFTVHLSGKFIIIFLPCSI